MLNGIHQRFELTDNTKNLVSQLVMPSRDNGYCFYSSHKPYFDIGADAALNCYLGQSEKAPSTLLFGDSFAGHNEPFFDDVFKINKQSLKVITTNWCIASFADNFTGPKSNPAYKQCLLNRRYLKNNLHKYKNIILSGAWGSALSNGHLDEVKVVIEHATKLGLIVFIMAEPTKYDKRIMSKISRLIYFNRPFDLSEVSKDKTVNTKANSFLQSVSNQHDNVHIISRNILYSKDDKFEIAGFELPYSLDGDHISIAASKSSAKNFIDHDKYADLMGHFQFDD